MKKNKLIIFTIAMLAISQAQSEPAVPGIGGRSLGAGRSSGSQTIEVHPTAWTQLELKGADKDLGSKIAAQITANPANAAALVEALIRANPEHAEAIAQAALVTLDVKSAAVITAAAVSAAPSSAAAITKAAVTIVPSSAAAITKAAVNAAPSLAVAITTAAVSAAPQASSAIVVAVVGLINNSAERNFSQSESTTSNTAVKQNIITAVLENTLQGCKDDQCKVDAAVQAVKQGGNSPDLAATLAGEIIKTVIANNPDNSKLEQALTKEIKTPASPS